MTKKGLKDTLSALKTSVIKRCSSRQRRPRLRDFPKNLSAVYTEQSYSYIDNGNNEQGSMADRMEVILLPRTFEELGTAPQSYALEPIASFLLSHYPSYHFVKGHMWNREMGGPGITENLVPLTTSANGAHKNKVETPLKAALNNFESFYERNENNYSHADYDKIYGFKYVVEIEKSYWPTVTESIVPNSLHVQLFPLKYQISGTISYDNSIINNAVSPLIRVAINRLVNGIWIDQNGVVTDA